MFGNAELTAWLRGGDPRATTHRYTESRETWVTRDVYGDGGHSGSEGSYLGACDGMETVATPIVSFGWLMVPATMRWRELGLPLRAHTGWAPDAPSGMQSVQLGSGWTGAVNRAGGLPYDSVESFEMAVAAFRARITADIDAVIAAIPRGPIVIHTLGRGAVARHLECDFPGGSIAIKVAEDAWLVRGPDGAVLGAIGKREWGDVELRGLLYRLAAQ